MPRPSLAFIPLIFASTGLAQLSPTGATASFRGSLPPPPVAALSADQEAILQDELSVATKSFAAVRQHERAADVEIFLKAVRYALEFDEWYDKKPGDGLKKGRELLAEAARRIESLKKNQTPWLNGPGQKVLGFYSDIDDSPQPYGVEVPDSLEWGSGKKPVPMWVWLHGRGDTQTDLHFVYSRLTAKKPGQFQPKGTIVIHPFGRYCNGYKSAGETDVFEARDDAIKRFNVDRERIALAGFSMGGAGAWHLGAHYADQWACVHAGAGFVDVKRYQKLTPEKMPPWYEQTLWGVYDVPDYARNFFNVPLIVYSGENDAQRDAAEFMSEVLAREGYTMKHLIGPGMGHKYHPEVIKEVQRLIEDAVAKGRAQPRLSIKVQTRTLRYDGLGWLHINRLENHWSTSSAEADCLPDGRLVVKTKNVAEILIGLPVLKKEQVGTRPGFFDGRMKPIPYFKRTYFQPKKVFIDETEVPFRLDYEGMWPRFFEKKNGIWQPLAEGDSLYKKAHLQGPIDDAFLHRFVIVKPDAKSQSARLEEWVNTELTHFARRWRSLMRGDAIIKSANQVTEQDIKNSHLILWGDPASNSLIRRILPQLPFRWNSVHVQFGQVIHSASDHVPLLIYPNPLRPKGYRYVVLNSGLTFREAHDRTNSLQNPKLPDWAIIDITQPPNAESPGKVVAADFFDERWQVKK